MLQVTQLTSVVMVVTLVVSVSPAWLAVRFLALSAVDLRVGPVVRTVVLNGTVEAHG